MKKKQKSVKEAIGEYEGAESFRGGPYGRGGKEQLAKPKEFIKNKDEEQILERGPSDGFYRDLNGYPEYNTLVKKQQFVKKDPNIDQKEFYGVTVNDKIIDGVDTWKSTELKKMGKLDYNTNDLAKQEKFIPEDENSNEVELNPGIKEEVQVSVKPSNKGLSIAGSSWSNGDTIAKKETHVPDEINQDTGDINAKNPIWSTGMVVKPKRLVPIDKNEPKSVRFKESNENMDKKILKEIIDILVEELLDEATPQSTQTVLPGFLQLGKYIKDTNFLNTLHNRALKIVDVNKTNPNRFQPEINELKNDLSSFEIPANVVNDIVDDLIDTRKKNVQYDKYAAQGALQKSLASRAVAQQKQQTGFIVPPPVQLTQRTSISPDEMASFKKYFEDYKVANPKLKQNIENDIKEQIKIIGPEEIRKWLAGGVLTLKKDLIEFYNRLLKTL